MPPILGMPVVTVLHGTGEFVAKINMESFVVPYSSKLRFEYSEIARFGWLSRDLMFQYRVFL